MNVLVAGGTGFLGRHISRSLLDGGHDVTVLSRDPRKVPRIQQLSGAQGVYGDVTDPYSLKGTMDGVDVVIVAIQFPNYPMELPRKGLTFDRYDRQGTEYLLAEAERSNVERFVYVSGVGVHPNSEKSWYRAKGRAEEIIRSAGIRYCILRPSWAYGPEDKALNKFATIARRSPIVPIPTRMEGFRLIDQRVQPVSCDDVAESVRRMVDTDAVVGKTLEIGSREVLTMPQVVRTMLDVMGLKRVVVPAPAPLMKIATAPLILLPKPPLTPAAVDFAVQDGLADPADLIGLLGVEPVSLREGLARYLGRR